MIFVLVSAIICINAGCDNLLGPDELEPSADGIYVFHPEDMPQIQFKYDMPRWEMTVNNRSSLTARITIRRHEEGSAGTSFRLRGFRSYTYVEMYEKGKRLRITISRDGITTNFSAKLD